jgi:hypothetical protein
VSLLLALLRPPAPPPPPPPVEAASGGGAPAQPYDDGWRGYALEQLYRQQREAEQKLKASPRPAAKKLVKRLRQYKSDEISLDEFRDRAESLIAKLRAQAELEDSLKQAAIDIEAYIKDEQEALDVLMLEAEYQRCVLAIVM